MARRGRLSSSRTNSSNSASPARRARSNLSRSNSRASPMPSMRLGARSRTNTQASEVSLPESVGELESVSYKIGDIPEKYRHVKVQIDNAAFAERPSLYVSGSQILDLFTEQNRRIRELEHRLVKNEFNVKKEQSVLVQPDKNDIDDRLHAMNLKITSLQNMLSTIQQVTSVAETDQADINSFSSPAKKQEKLASIPEPSPSMSGRKRRKLIVSPAKAAPEVSTRSKSPAPRCPAPQKQTPRKRKASQRSSRSQPEPTPADEDDSLQSRMDTIEQSCVEGDSALQDRIEETATRVKSMKARMGAIEDNNTDLRKGQRSLEKMLKVNASNFEKLCDNQNELGYRTDRLRTSMDSHTAKLDKYYEKWSKNCLTPQVPVESLSDDSVTQKSNDQGSASLERIESALKLKKLAQDVDLHEKQVKRNTDCIKQEAGRVTNITRVVDDLRTTLASKHQEAIDIVNHHTTMLNEFDTQWRTERFFMNLPTGRKGYLSCMKLRPVFQSLQDLVAYMDSQFRGFMVKLRHLENPSIPRTVITSTAGIRMITDTQDTHSSQPLQQLKPLPTLPATTLITLPNNTSLPTLHPQTGPGNNPKRSTRK